jgi:hypothetical protein
MGVIYNYIDESERIFLENTAFTASVDDYWTSDGTLSADPVVFQDSDFGSLKLNPSTSEHYIKYNYWAVPATDIPSQYAVTPNQDINDFVESFFWVRSTVNCTIYLKTVLRKVTYNTGTQKYMLSTNAQDIITGAEGTHVVSLGALDQNRFHLLRAVPVELPTTGNYSVSLHFRVVFDTLVNASLNISRPTSHPSYRVFRNGFASEVLNVLPEVFLESDTANFGTNQPTFVLSRFTEIACSVADEIYDKTYQFEYLDISEGQESNDLDTLSTLINPQICDGDTLFWLAQFRGRPILVTYQPSTEGVGWEVFTLNGSLLTGLDPITGLPVGNDVLGTDASASSQLPSGIDAFARWQVETGYYGHNAGTLQAMISAIQRALTNQKIVNYTKSTNQIAFTTSQAETFGTVVGDIGTSVPNIIALIEPARPLGMIVTHTLTA